MRKLIDFPHRFVWLDQLHHQHDVVLLQLQYRCDKEYLRTNKNLLMNRKCGHYERKAREHHRPPCRWSSFPWELTTHAMLSWWTGGWKEQGLAGPWFSCELHTIILIFSIFTYMTCQAITKIRRALHGYQNNRWDDLNMMDRFTHTGTD